MIEEKGKTEASPTESRSRKASKQKYPQSPVLGAQAFKEIFNDLIERERLTITSVANIIGVNRSNLNRLLRNERRNPPRNQSFYDKLYQIPGWTKADIAYLMSTSVQMGLEDAPQSEQKPESPPSRIAEGQAGSLSFTLKVYADELEDWEIDPVTEILRQQVILTALRFQKTKQRKDQG